MVKSGVNTVKFQIPFGGSHQIERSGKISLGAEKYLLRFYF